MKYDLKTTSMPVGGSEEAEIRRAIINTYVGS